jgi:lactonase
MSRPATGMVAPGVTSVLPTSPLAGFAATAGNTLSHTSATRGLVPIPASERGLVTATAEPLFKVSDQAICLEGPAFDRNGNLLFLDVYNGKVFRLSPSRQLTTLYEDNQLHPGGIAIHKDGRVFLACLGAANSQGQFTAGTVVALDRDGSNRRTIVPPSAGYVLDDMVFDNAGGFYMTDFRGSSTRAEGGVYYVPPDLQTVVPVLPNMCAANGVALSPDSKVLWATEYALNRLHRIELAAPGVIGRHGASVPYHFIGRAPDSMRADSAGNVYVAMNWQARILVLSPNGMPIGQILLPGREDDLWLKSTSLALMPDSRELLIVARDALGGRGAMIFSARGPAPGFRMFSHQ